MREEIRCRRGPVELLVPLLTLPGSVPLDDLHWGLPGGMTLSLDAGAVVSMEEQPVDDEHLRAAWGERLLRLCCRWHSKGPVLVVHWRLH